MTGELSRSLIDLKKILEDVFLVLTQKEKEVIIKRFSLNNEPRQTLEAIGQQFSVTRERIRQIEKIALNKLRRTLDNTRLSEVAKLSRELIHAHGGICLEDQLVSEILQKLMIDSPIEGYIVRLALAIHPEMIRTEKNNVFHPFVYEKHYRESDLQLVCDAIHSILEKNKNVIPLHELTPQIEAHVRDKNLTIPRDGIISLINVDVRFKKVPEGVGLIVWRHINPKSIRDKAYIVLKRGGKPLHFVEIANSIASSAFDRKVVTTQAVHNELIRDEQFVLVGRGLYGLKEWGYKRGTVADIIEDLLSKKSPLTKQEIINGVLKQRHVKKGTISLNLQKNPNFARVGRAVYALKK